MKQIIKILISAALIVILCFNIDFAFVIDEIGKMTSSFFIRLMLLYIVIMALAIVKWRILLPSVSFVPFIKAYLYGGLFMVILPGQVFGEAAKIAAFGKYTKQVDKSISTVLIDKITGILALLITGLFGLVFSRGEAGGAFALVFGACMAAVLAILLLLRFGKVKDALCSIARLPQKMTPKFEKVSVHAIALIETWREYLYMPKTLAKSLLVGLLFNAVTILQYYFICAEYAIPVGMIDLCWIMAVVSIAQALPVSLAGIGVRDVSLVTMFAYIGVKAESAVLLSMVILILFIVRALAGAGCMFFDMLARRGDAHKAQ